MLQQLYAHLRQPIVTLARVAQMMMTFRRMQQQESLSPSRVHQQRDLVESVGPGPD
jgi:hypothetical protein